MKVVVAVPWRPQSDRIEAHDFVVKHFRSLMPEAEVIEVDTDHEVYNLAASRNEGVRCSEMLGADVVVITDADCIICPHASLVEAISAAAVDGKVHLPFRVQHYLSEAETSLFMSGQVVVPTGGARGEGACYVVTPTAYWSAGGSDERFSGWGGEDQGFIAAASALVGVVKHEGHAVSLWHESLRDVGSDRWKPNSELAQRYWKAKSNPRVIRSIIDEREV